MIICFYSVNMIILFFACFKVIRFKAEMGKKSGVLFVLDLTFNFFGSNDLHQYTKRFIAILV